MLKLRLSIIFILSLILMTNVKGVARSDDSIDS